MLAALGVLRAGGVIVPLNTRFKGGEAAYILRNSGAELLVTVRGFLGFDYPSMLGGEDVGPLERILLLRDEGTDDGNVERPAPLSTVGLTDFLAAGERIAQDTTKARVEALQPDDVSDLIFTSGTTGHPKGAVTTHAQSLRTFGTWASIVGLGSGDRYLIVNPFFHTFGYKAGILACLMAGATVVPGARVRCGSGAPPYRGGTHQRAAGTTDPLPDAAGRLRPGTSTICPLCASA